MPPARRATPNADAAINALARVSARAQARDLPVEIQMSPGVPALPPGRIVRRIHDRPAQRGTTVAVVIRFEDDTEREIHLGSIASIAFG